jgi:hypothetical protein
MRVIRTEMYFNRGNEFTLSSLDQSKENFGISFAFFRSDNDIDAQDLRKEIDGEWREYQDFYGVEDKLRLFLEGIFYGAQNLDYVMLERKSLSAGSYVAAVFESSLVVERSPPQEFPLSIIGKAATSVTIGTFIGYNVAPAGSPLMFVTIPFGIIVIGAAIGVSRALENGLNKSLERVIKRRLKS